MVVGEFGVDAGIGIDAGVDAGVDATAIGWHVVL